MSTIIDTPFAIILIIPFRWAEARRLRPSFLTAKSFPRYVIRTPL